MSKYKYTAVITITLNGEIDGDDLETENATPEQAQKELQDALSDVDDVIDFITDLHEGSSNVVAKVTVI